MCASALDVSVDVVMFVVGCEFMSLFVVSCCKHETSESLLFDDVFAAFSLI